MNPENRPHQPRSLSDNPLNTVSGPLRVAHMYFSGIVEDTFMVKLGVPDPKIHSYVSDLLVRSLSTDALAIRGLNGRVIDEVEYMISEAELRIGEAKLLAHLRVGERILFWTGLYPESISQIGSLPDTSTDIQKDLKWWFGRGKGAYSRTTELLSELRGESAEQEQRLYTSVADNFEMIAYGLRESRQTWESDAQGGDSSIISL